MTKIKICGLTRAQDVLDAVEQGADAIGFVFYEKSPRHVTLEQAAELVRLLPPFVSSVGLFVNPSSEQVRRVLETIPLNLLQFHGEEHAEFCASFKCAYLKAIRVRLETDLVECAAHYADAQGLLLDAYVEGTHGGTGATFDWQLIPRNLTLPIVLSGGLQVENIAAAIQQVRPWAVDVSSGVEREKGIKDAAKIAAFIKEVKDIDVSLSRQ